MRRSSWQILLGISLIVLSVLVYGIHYAIFRDPHHIFIYMVGDIAFVFIEVMLVTLVIHRVLSERERRARLEKLNVVVGAFFGEVGTTLLIQFSDLDPSLDEIKQHLVVTGDWSDQEFVSVTKRLRRHNYAVEIQKASLGDLRDFLVEKKDFLLRLLENPNLLEHESFTELLQAVFHVMEELIARKELTQLPAADYEHLAVDIERAYTRLVHRWLDYMRHLKNNYPYLFSLAMRTNPFDETASPIVR